VDPNVAVRSYYLWNCSKVLGFRVPISKQCEAPSLYINFSLLNECLGDDLTTHNVFDHERLFSILSISDLTQSYASNALFYFPFPQKGR
jgi:hypothetical protein